MLTVMTAALAATPNQAELAVPAGHYLVAPEQPIGASRLIYYDGKQSDRTVPSTHPAVTCFVEDGYLGVKMEATQANYPQSFPFTASCSALGEPLDVTVVAMNPAVDPSLQSMRIDASDSVFITKPGKSAAVMRSYLLPDGPLAYDYGNEVMAAGLNGVFCVAMKQQDGSAVLRVLTSTGADLGAGICQVPRANGRSTYPVAVHLSQAPI